MLAAQPEADHDTRLLLHHDVHDPRPVQRFRHGRSHPAVTHEDDVVARLAEVEVVELLDRVGDPGQPLRDDSLDPRLERLVDRDRDQRARDNERVRPPVDET